MTGLRFVLVCCVALAAVSSQAWARENSLTNTTLRVPENTEAGRSVGFVPPPVRERLRKCTIVSGNQDGAFSINERTGELTVNNPAALNHESHERFDLLLRVECPVPDDPARRAFLNDVIDSGAPQETVQKLLTETHMVDLKVLVEDVPETPVLPMQSTTIVLSGKDPQVSAWVGAEDEDRNDALRFQILGGAPPGLFSMDARTGRLHVDRPGELTPGDYTFPLTVQVTDSSGRSDATTLSVRVVSFAGSPSLLAAAGTPTPANRDNTSHVDALLASVDHDDQESFVPNVTAAAPPATMLASSTIRPQRETPRPRVRVATRPQPVATTDAGPPADDLRSRIFGIGRIFLLLGSVVVAGLLWLKWRSRREEDALVEESARWIRLQSLADDADAGNNGDIGPAPDISPVEEVDLLEEQIFLDLIALNRTLSDSMAEARLDEVPTDPADVEAAGYIDGASRRSASQGDVVSDVATPILADESGAAPDEPVAQLATAPNQRHESEEWSPDSDGNRSLLPADSRQSTVEDRAEAASVSRTAADAVAQTDWEAETLEEAVMAHFDEAQHSLSEAVSIETRADDEVDESQNNIEIHDFDESTSPRDNETNWKAVDFAEAASIDVREWVEASPDNEPVSTADDLVNDMEEPTTDPDQAPASLAARGADQPSSGAMPVEMSANEPVQGLPAAGAEAVDSTRWEADAGAGTESRNTSDELYDGDETVDLEYTALRKELAETFGTSAPFSEAEPIRSEAASVETGAACEYDESRNAAVIREVDENASPPGDETRRNVVSPAEVEPIELNEWCAAPSNGGSETTSDAAGDVVIDAIDETTTDPDDEPLSSAEPGTDQPTSGNVSDEAPANEPVQGLTGPGSEIVESPRGTADSGSGAEARDPEDGPSQSEADEPYDGNETVDLEFAALRKELAEKFGISPSGPVLKRQSSPADEAEESSDPPREELTRAPANESDSESTPDADGSPAAPSTAQSLAPGGSDGSGDVSASDRVSAQASLSESAGTMRLRRSKTEIRKELSSLRAVANQHARAEAAVHATRRRTRQIWSQWAAVMVVLNFAAMGLLGASPNGILRIIGWGLMLGGAGALAVCLHLFRQMVSIDESDSSDRKPAR